MGVVCEISAVFLILNLARTLIGLARGRRNVEPTGAAPPAWSFAWRIAAIAILMAFVGDLAGVLRIDYAQSLEIGASRPGWLPSYICNENLLPMCGTLGIIGLALGMGAGALFDDPRPARHRPYWLSVPLAAVIAALLPAFTGYSIVVYILLVSLEGVSNAMRYAQHAGPGLIARLLDSGVDATLAFAAILALALVVARDFDRARRRLSWGTRAAGWIVRAVLLLCAISASAYVAIVTIPKIHPCFGEGFLATITPRAIFVMIAGFGLLAVGMAARAVVPSPSLERPRWLRWLSAFFRYGLLLVFFLAAMRRLPASGGMSALAPTIVGRVFDVVGRVQTWVWGLLPYPALLVLDYCLEAEMLRWIVAASFVGIVAIELTVTMAAPRIAPLDGVFSRRRSGIEIGWLTVALTVVCIAALPPAAVFGQFFINVQLNLEDWIRIGWPR
jgi:hypothetical protein